MRLLPFGLLLVLASGLSIILIYISGISNFGTGALLNSLIACKSFKLEYFYLKNFRCFVDPNLRLSNQDLEALQALQSSFQQCVVSFIFVCCSFLLLFIFVPVNWQLPMLCFLFFRVVFFCLSCVIED